VPRDPDRLPDWFVGGAGKRRLLSAVVRGGSDKTWTESELASASGLSPKNTVRRHIAVLVQAGVLTGSPGAYSLNKAN
jgi:DNA-binding IclR family transcriptional regulator